MLIISLKHQTLQDIREDEKWCAATPEYSSEFPHEIGVALRLGEVLVVFGVDIASVARFGLSEQWILNFRLLYPLLSGELYGIFRLLRLLGLLHKISVMLRAVIVILHYANVRDLVRFRCDFSFLQTFWTPYLFTNITSFLLFLGPVLYFKIPVYLVGVLSI